LKSKNQGGKSGYNYNSSVVVCVKMEEPMRVNTTPIRSERERERERPGGRTRSRSNSPGPSREHNREERSKARER